LALGQLLRSGVCAAAGNVEQAASLLETALARCEEAELNLFAAVARRQLGRLVGADRGDELEQAALSTFTAQGVAEPDNLCAMLTPGFKA
jgi:hypothetical protein